MNVGDEKGIDAYYLRSSFSCSFSCFDNLQLIVICVLFGTGSILDSVVCEVAPNTVLELGTYCGYSTVRIASQLPPGARLLTLEFNPSYAAVARQIIAWAGLEERVRADVAYLCY